MNIIKSRVLGFSFAAAFGCLTGCAAAESGDLTSEPLVSNAEALIEGGITRWDNHRVDVCFTNWVTSTQEQWFKQAVLDSWSAVANVDFVYDLCPSLDMRGTPHIAVTWDKAHPSGTWTNAWGHCEYGRPVPGSGDIRNDCLISYCDPTVPPGDCSRAEEALRGTVMHEIGHALGLAHEHQNPARPADLATWCHAPVPPTHLNEQWLVDNGLPNQHFTNVCPGSGPTVGCGESACAGAGIGCDAWGACLGCFTNAQCQNGETCDGTGHCTTVNCTKVVDTPASFAVAPYDAASIMNYCRVTAAPRSDWLSPWDKLEGKIMYGGRPFVQGLSDSGGFLTSTGWVSNGKGKLVPEYVAAGALSSAYASPKYFINNVLQTSTIDMPTSKIPAGSTRSVSLWYTDPFGASPVITQSVENNPVKFTAIMVNMI